MIRLSQEQVEAAAKEVSEATGKLVRVANKNTPLQFVLSGHREAVEAAAEKLKAENPRAKGFPLAVSGAFHTPMMAEARRNFPSCSTSRTGTTRSFPFIPTHGEPLSDAEALHSACAVNDLVRVLGGHHFNQWRDACAAGGVRSAGVLTRMVRPILVAADVADGSYTTVHIPNKDAVDAFEG